MANESSAFLHMLALLDSVDTVTRASLATPCILTTEGAGYIPD